MMSKRELIDMQSMKGKKTLLSKRDGHIINFMEGKGEILPSNWND